MRAITNVSTKRDGLMNSAALVSSAGRQVAFRVSHSEAMRTHDIILHHVG